MTPRNRSATGSPATYSAPEPVPSSHDRTTSAANSGPLSLRTRHGGPPRSAATPARMIRMSSAVMPLLRLQRQAFTSILIDEAQPLQAPAVAGPIEDEVPGPHVVLAARGPEMAGVLVLPMLAAGLGIGPRTGHLQPRLAVEAAHRLLVDRPALAIQQGPDPPVAEPGVRPGQFLDGRRATPPARRGRRARSGGRSAPGPAPDTRRSDAWNCSHSYLTMRRRRRAVMAFFSRPPGACGGRAPARRPGA